MENKIIKLNNRRYKRLFVPIAIKFNLTDKAGVLKPKEYAAIARDISEGGISAEITGLEKGLLKEDGGYIVALNISLPGCTDEISAIAQPVWHKVDHIRQKQVIGMKFSEIVDSDKEILNTYILGEFQKQEQRLITAIATGELKEIGLGGNLSFLAKILEFIRIVKLIGFGYLLKLGKAKKIGGEIQGGFFVTRVVNTLLNTGFFKQISLTSEVDVEQFSVQNNLDKRILYLLCDYLCSRGIFKKSRSGYVLSVKGSLIKEMLSGIFNISYAFEDIFHNLEPLLRKEKIIYRDVNRSLEFEAKGTGEAAKLLPFSVMKQIIINKKFKNVLDIGCGSAAFLIELCKTSPEIRGYGVDMSDGALLYAQDQLKISGFENRIKLFEGNILNDLEELSGFLSGENINVITGSFILHELFFEKKEGIVKFLIKLKSKFKNITLLICENVKLNLEELRKNPGLYSELQLMHGLSCEQQLTRNEWREVFKDSGFKMVEERYLSFAEISIFIVYS